MPAAPPISISYLLVTFLHFQHGICAYDSMNPVIPPGAPFCSLFLASSALLLWALSSAPVLNSMRNGTAWPDRWEVHNFVITPRSFMSYSSLLQTVAMCVLSSLIVVKTRPQMRPTASPGMVPTVTGLKRMRCVKDNLVCGNKNCLLAHPCLCVGNLKLRLVVFSTSSLYGQKFNN